MASRASSWRVSCRTRRLLEEHALLLSKQRLLQC